MEADRLHAVIDGLTVHAATRPEVATVEKLRSVLGRHLDTLGGLR